MLWFWHCYPLDLWVSLFCYHIIWNPVHAIVFTCMSCLIQCLHVCVVSFRTVIPSWGQLRERAGSLAPSLFRNVYNVSRVKRICVFEHSVMTHFNCACPAIQSGQRSGFLSEGSSWLTAGMSEQRRFWRDCADAQARLNLRCSHRR